MIFAGSISHRIIGTPLLGRKTSKLGVFTNRLFHEDKDIVEMGQKAWNRQGGDQNIEVFLIVKKLRHLLRSGGVPHKEVPREKAAQHA